MDKNKNSKGVISAAALLGIGTTTTIVEMASPDIQGTWISTVSLSGWGVHKGESPKARIVLKITKTDGNYQVTCENIDKGIKDVPFLNFTYKHGFLHAEIPSDARTDLAVRTFYDAKVNFSGTKISGKLSEPKTSLPMVFSRTTNPPAFPEPLADSEFAPRAGSDLQGFWTGAIKIGKNGLRINIKIAEPSDGTFRADIYVPDQGTNRQPTSVSYDGTTVKLMPMAGYGMFQGELRNGGTEMAGKWIQGGQQLPTTFTRAN